MGEKRDFFVNINKNARIQFPQTMTTLFVIPSGQKQSETHPFACALGKWTPKRNEKITFIVGYARMHIALAWVLYAHNRVTKNVNKWTNRRENSKNLKA